MDQQIRDQEAAEATATALPAVIGGEKHAETRHKRMTRPDAGFLVQLIATKADAMQYRQKRRVPAIEAQAAYRGVPGKIPKATLSASI
jgi:hypothetical protein